MTLRKFDRHYQGIHALWFLNGMGSIRKNSVFYIPKSNATTFNDIDTIGVLLYIFFIAVHYCTDTEFNLKHLTNPAEAH